MTILKKMPIVEFDVFINCQFPLYQYDNLMLARVLQWQKSFGLKQDALVTAAVMLDNDPLDKQAQQALQKQPFPPQTLEISTPSLHIAPAAGSDII